MRAARQRAPGAHARGDRPHDFWILKEQTDEIVARRHHPVETIGHDALSVRQRPQASAWPQHSFGLSKNGARITDRRDQLLLQPIRISLRYGV
jgi:hypothetical protein